MASRTVVTIVDPLGFSPTYGNKRLALRQLGSNLKAIAAGTRLGDATVELRTAGVRATGTFTSTTAIATDAISINGVTFTAVASGATGDQWNIGADDTEDCVNLAAAINASASALVSEHVTATSATNVVTLTAKQTGTTGNAITISSADATIVASGARLTGGTETLTSLSF